MKLLNQIFRELLQRGKLSRQEAIDLVATGQVSSHLLPDLFEVPKARPTPVVEEPIWTLELQEELEAPRRPKVRRMRKHGRQRRHNRKGERKGVVRASHRG